MTPEQFAYWLQGFAELNPGAPTQEQWQSIRDRLALVFTKVTPDPGVMPIAPYIPYGPFWEIPKPGCTGDPLVAPIEIIFSDKTLICSKTEN